MVKLNRKGSIEGSILPVLIVVAVIIVGLMVLTGQLGSLFSMVGSAFYYILAFVIGGTLIAFLYVYYKVEEREKKNIRYKQIFGGVGSIVVIMLVLINLPTVFGVIGTATGRLTGTSAVSFPVAVTSPNSLYLALGTKIAITSVGAPSVSANSYSLSIPSLGIFGNTVGIGGVALCSINGSAFTQVATSSFSVYLNAFAPGGGQVTKSMRFNGIPDEGTCMYKFTLSGPSVQANEVYTVLYAINTNGFSDEGYTLT